MPKRPTADANDMSFFGGKKAKTLDDDLRELSLMIAQAAVAGIAALVTELKEQQTALERREAERKKEKAEAAYESAKKAYEKIKTSGPKKEATKVIMDQAHAVYLALLGACLYLGKN